MSRPAGSESTSPSSLCTMNLSASGRRSRDRGGAQTRSSSLSISLKLAIFLPPLAAAHAELERELPERLTIRAAYLRRHREDVRAAAQVSQGQEAARARCDAQQISIRLRSIELVLTEWLARAEIARPSAPITSVFGPRPTEPAARGAWDRGVTLVATYRRSRSIAADDASLLGPRPLSAEARSAWEAAMVAAGEALPDLQRPRETLERLAAEGHARGRER